jgi:hypothetical protein
MGIQKTFIQLWENKAEILEGIKNNVFKSEHVEMIAGSRMKICVNCKLFDNGEDKSACLIAGTTPCCNQNKGGCGCSLPIATRSLSKACPLGKWEAELTQAQEDALQII